MNGANIEHESNATDIGEGTDFNQSGPNIVIEGEFIPVSQDDAGISELALQQAAAGGDLAHLPAEVRASFARTIFGGLVILTDELGGLASSSDEQQIPRDTMEAALQRAVELQESAEDRPLSNLRYGALGLLSGALESTQSSAERVSKLTGRVARISGKVIRPVWNSFLFKPLHSPMMRAEQVAEERVDRWVARGRVEEVRSRAIAEVGINNFVDNSVTEIADSEQVRMIIQQVIDSQGTSLLGDVLGQARQRIVGLDSLLLNRLKKDQVAAPNIRDRYLQDMTARRPQYGRIDLGASLAGTFAGPLARLTAFVIDLLILLFAAGLFSSFISSTLALFDLRGIVISFLQSGGLLPLITVIFIVITNFVIIGLYFVTSWFLFGSTPGDLVLGIRVVNYHGQHVSFWRSFLRIVGYFLSTIVLFLGFIWALFDRRRQGWHDKIAGTLVLYDWPAEKVVALQSDHGMIGSEDEDS